MIIGVTDLISYLGIVVADSIEISNVRGQIRIISFIGMVLAAIGAALLVYGVMKVSYSWKIFLIESLFLLF